MITVSRQKTMRNAVVAAVLAVVLTVSANSLFPHATQAVEGNAVSSQSQCGFATTCMAQNPSGIQLSLSINTTSVEANSSMSFFITIANPSNHGINLPNPQAWYLPQLPASLICNSGSDVYAFVVFKGYYTLQNVSLGENIIYPDAYPACIFTGNPTNTTSYSIPPMSTLIPPLALGQASQIYAVSGGTVRVGNASIGVYSLRDDKPAVYTMVAGDEWGDLVLVSFSVTVGT